MRKNIIITLSLILILLVLTTVLFFLKNDKPGVVYTQDEIKFKSEFEKVNDNEIDDIKLLNIKIEEDNNIEYINDYDKLIDKLESGTNVILLGWNSSNACRLVVPTLIEVLKNNNIDKLYYYDFKSIYDGYINNYNKYKDKYEGIVNIIGDRIDTVFETDNELNGVKEILVPTVIFVKEGNVVGVHSKSIDSHTDDNTSLNEDELKELKQKYQELIDIMNADVCVEDNDGC